MLSPLYDMSEGVSTLSAFSTPKAPHLGPSWLRGGPRELAHEQLRERAGVALLQAARHEGVGVGVGGAPGHPRAVLLGEGVERALQLLPPAAVEREQLQVAGQVGVRRARRF